MKIYWIRHAETDANRLAMVQGMLDVPLSTRGQQQVEEMAERLRNRTLDAIVTSDLERALCTAQGLARTRPDTPVLTRPGLRERHFGVRQGHPIAWGTRPAAGEEPSARFRFRVMQEVRWLMQQPYGTVAVVTHGGVLRVVADLIIPGAVYHFDNTSVSLMESHGKDTRDWTVHCLNWT